MRILMVAPEPFFEARGTSLSVAHRIQSLCAGGDEVDLVTYPIGQAVRIEGLTVHRSPKIPGIRSVPIGPSLRKLVLNVWMLPLLLRRVATHRYDLLYSHEEASVVCGLLSRIFGLPHIYDMHSNLVQNVQNYSWGRWHLVVWAFVVARRLMLRFSDVILTICDDLERDVRRDAPGTPVFLIQNTRTKVNFLDERVSTPRQLARRHGLDDRPVALYIGSFEPYQGLDLLVDAIAETVTDGLNCQFLIVGGADKQVRALRKTLEARDLSCRVRVVPRVSPRTVDSYIALADVLLTPRNRGTNVPLKLYGFMKTGKPIVATRLPTHTQVLDDDTAVLAAPEPRAFAAAIRTALTDRALALRVTANAARRAEAMYRSDTYDEQLREAVRLATGWRKPQGVACAE